MSEQKPLYQHFFLLLSALLTVGFALLSLICSSLVYGVYLSSLIWKFIYLIPSCLWLFYVLKGYQQRKSRLFLALPLIAFLAVPLFETLYIFWNFLSIPCPDSFWEEFFIKYLDRLNLFYKRSYALLLALSVLFLIVLTLVPKRWINQKIKRILWLGLTGVGLLVLLIITIRHGYVLSMYWKWEADFTDWAYLLFVNFSLLSEVFFFVSLLLLEARKKKPLTPAKELLRLAKKRDVGKISEEEYQARRSAILERL